MNIINIPFSKGSMGKNKGTELAPDEILKQTKDFYLTETGFVPRVNSKNINEIEIDSDNIENTHTQIQTKLEKVFQNKSKTIILGGDHSITYSTFKAFAKENPGAGLVIFDAHPDCENNISPPTHEDFLKTLIQEGIVDPKRVILVALRNGHGKEKEFIELNKIRTFPMKQIAMFGKSDVCDTITESIREWPAFYLSIDIDAIDPAFAPGTGYIEPAGLTSRELIYFIQRLNRLPNLKAADIVEVNPDKDINNLTTKLAAKILVELS